MKDYISSGWHLRKVPFSLILPVPSCQFVYMYAHTMYVCTGLRLGLKLRLDHVQIQLISGCLYHCGKRTSKLTNQMWVIPKRHRVRQVSLVSLVLPLFAYTYIPVVGNEETRACAGNQANEIVTECWNDWGSATVFNKRLHIQWVISMYVRLHSPRSFLSVCLGP